MNFSWLIRMLGGSTPEEYKLLESQYNTQRSLSDSLRARVEFLEGRINELEGERKEIQNLLYKQVGLISSPESGPVNIDDLKPIQTARPRWSQVKRAMEQDDLKRVRVNGLEEEN
jgi:hypothetical protein